MTPSHAAQCDCPWPVINIASSSLSMSSHPIISNLAAEARPPKHKVRPPVCVCLCPRPSCSLVLLACTLCAWSVSILIVPLGPSSHVDDSLASLNCSTRILRSPRSERWWRRRSLGFGLWSCYIDRLKCVYILSETHQYNMDNGCSYRSLPHSDSPLVT